MTTPARPRDRERRPSWRTSAGAVAAEQVAVVALVAAIIAAVTALALPTQVGDWARYAVCQLFSSGEACVPPELAGGTSATTDEDYLPPACLRLEEREHGGYTIKVGFVEFGEDHGFIRQEFADGRVRLTVVDSATLGLVKSGDTRLIDLGRLGTDEDAGASVDVGAGVKFGYGDTWEFASEDEEEQLRDQLERYLIQQIQLRHDAHGGASISRSIQELLGIGEGWVEPPKDPTISFSKLGVDGSLEAALGLRSPIDTGDDGSPRYLDPNVGVHLTLDGSYEVVTETDRGAGTRSYTYTLSGSGAVGADVTVGSGSLEGTSTGSFKVTRDASGELVEIEMVSTRAGGVSGELGVSNPVEGAARSGSASGGHSATTATVTTTRVALDDDDDRAVVERWLADNNEQFGTPLALTTGQLVPTGRVVGDEFQNLLFDRATVSSTTFDDVEDVRSFGLDVKAGLEFGFSVELADGTRTAASASYLGAPRGNGERSFVEDPTCR